MAGTYSKQLEKFILPSTAILTDTVWEVAFCGWLKMNTSSSSQGRQVAISASIALIPNMGRPRSPGPKTRLILSHKTNSKGLRYGEILRLPIALSIIPCQI
jgi:hypothetical protein